MHPVNARCGLTSIAFSLYPRSGPWDQPFQGKPPLSIGHIIPGAQPLPQPPPPTQPSEPAPSPREGGGPGQGRVGSSRVCGPQLARLEASRGPDEGAPGFPEPGRATIYSAGNSGWFISSVSDPRRRAGCKLGGGRWTLLSSPFLPCFQQLPHPGTHGHASASALAQPCTNLPLPSLAAPWWGPPYLPIWQSRKREPRLFKMER